jgi:hypothetical protein
MSVLAMQARPWPETVQETTPIPGGLGVTLSVLDLQGLPLPETADGMTPAPSNLSVDGCDPGSALSLLLCGVGP